MISAIVASDINFGIGFNNQLLESIPEDLKHFKDITTDKVVIMGRKTWDSLPKKPLPNRYNIIITRTPPEDQHDNENFKFCTLSDVINYLYTTEDEVFIIGGEAIYAELLAYCEKIYLTLLDKEFANVDTFFPNFIESGSWVLTKASNIKKHNNTSYQFQEYTRNNGLCLEKCEIDKN